MKKLQNNFTTPEQSKRLLELSVPADSADCVHTYLGIRILPEGIVYSNYDWMVADGDNRTPCWSVGRLIEIDLICRNTKSDKGLIPRLFVIYNPNILEELVSYIERTVSEYDFSKLEE